MVRHKYILYANTGGLPPYHISGAEITIDEFLTTLSLNNYNCSAIACLENYFFATKQYHFIGSTRIEKNEEYYKKHFLYSKEKFEEFLQKSINECPPDLIITQLGGTEITLRIGREHHIPTILFIHSLNNIKEFQTELMDKNVQNVITISSFLKSSLPPTIQKKSIICYPQFIKSKYESNSIVKKDSILFVNPCYVKGVATMIKLVKYFANEKFLFVDNWYQPVQKYKDIIMQNKNVTYLSMQKEMKHIYAIGKLLLMPSLTSEGFGRCIVEANINGIPAIVSNIGGLTEAAGNANIIIDNYKNTSAWIDAIELFLNKSQYEKSLYNKLCRNNSKRFLRSNYICDVTDNIFKKVAAL